MPSLATDEIWLMQLLSSPTVTDYSHLPRAMTSHNYVLAIITPNYDTLPSTK
jgi:hypothetical protein